MLCLWIVNLGTLDILFLLSLSYHLLELWDVKKMKVIVAAGGTGGHIYPALAIINKIKEYEKDSEILYIGTTDRMEKDVVPKTGIPYVGIEMAGFNRKQLLANVGVMKKVFKAVKKAKKTIAEFQPDIVIGVGGYITAPVLYAAHKLHYKTMIHEQNSIPGVSNKFLAHFVDKICLSFPGSLTYFPKNKSIYTGNPRSEEIITIDKISKVTFGFSSRKKLVIIVMGSLGSTTMTKKLKEAIVAFQDKSYQVLVITGKAYYDEYKDIDVPKNVKVIPYTEQLIQLMKDADLMVSRAGASTISEITGIGLPAILVPSPYVTHNHQVMNATELKEAGACEILEEAEFCQEKLVALIDSIMENEPLYQTMMEASKKFGVKDSATRIYQEIKELVR